MEFTLHYRGRLKAHGTPQEKHLLRTHYHTQLKALWNQLPLNDHRDLLKPEPPERFISVIRQVGKFKFAPLVSSRIYLIAEIRITLLRPEPPGSIITQAGDIDNRLKTLLDSLKVPSEPDALPINAKPSPDEEPFFCLLEDDNLVTNLSISTDRLLEPSTSPSEVVLLLHVQTKITRSIWANVGL